MTIYSFGDLALVPFPFTDQSAIKKRPAVIVSSKEYNRSRPDIVIMAVTSQMHSVNYFGDIEVNQWQQAGLLKPSVIKPIFTTLETDIVIKKLGQLSINDQKTLVSTLQEILGR